MTGFRAFRRQAERARVNGGLHRRRWRAAIDRIDVERFDRTQRLARGVDVADDQQGRAGAMAEQFAMRRIQADRCRTHQTNTAQVIERDGEVARRGDHALLIGKIQRGLNRCGLAGDQIADGLQMDRRQRCRTDIDIERDRRTGRIPIVGQHRHGGRAAVAGGRRKDHRLAVAAQRGRAIRRAGDAPVDRLAAPILVPCDTICFWGQMRI